MRKQPLHWTALAAASALLLAGCSSSSDDAASDGPVEITFAASMLGEPARGPLLQEMIDAFNASQDGVIVTPSSVPFSSFGTTIATQMGGGGGPDLIAFDHPNFFAAVDADLVVPIDDIVDEDALLPGNDNLVVDDERYGVALDIGNYALIYNPTLVSTPPTSFDDLVAQAKALTKDGVYGYAFRHTQAEEAGVWYDLSNFVYGFGGSWSDAKGEPTINSDKNVEGVTAFKEIYDAGVIPQGTDAATYRKMFSEGKIAFMIDNGGIPTVIQGANPEAAIAAVQTPLPSGEAGQVMAVLGVNANSKHVDATKQFLEWLLAEQQQATIQGFLGGSTAATAVDREASELEEHPYIAVFDEAGDSAHTFVPTGLEVVTPQVRTIVVTAVLAALQNGTDVGAALDAAQAEVEALL